MPVGVLRRKERKEFGITFPWKLKSVGLLSSTLHFLVTGAWSNQLFCKILENSRFVGKVVRDGFPKWQWGRRLSQVGKADRKTSTNILFCSECLAVLEDEGILLHIGYLTRLLSSGKPPNNLPGCQLWFLGYTFTVLFSWLSFIPPQYTVDEDAISQQPMHLTPALLLERHVPFHLRQENKALLSLLHSSPLSPVWEWERRAAYVMKRKDNVILLYGCYDYDYYFIIIIFYSGF